MTDQETAPNLEELWESYRSRLLAFIRSRVSDETEAEDLLQEVFLRIHNNLCCPPEPAKMEPWIYQIARNLIIDHYRGRKDLPEISEDLPAEFEFQEEDPEARLALSLKEMINQLPETYREAVLLSEIEELTQKEVAERLDISLSGAKSRVQRGRQKLRELLLACCHFEMDRRGRIIDYYERCCCCVEN
jgi:RNA polymerase sigma-70 factor, ECF subfamily